MDAFSLTPAPSLSLPRLAGEGTLAINAVNEGPHLPPLPLAGEGWGGGKAAMLERLFQ